MTIQIERGIVAILHTDGNIKGTGFVVAPRLLVTCAHVVVDAGSGPGKTVNVRFHHGGAEFSAEVRAEFWRPRDANIPDQPGERDIAVLEINEDLPSGVTPLPLGIYPNTSGMRFESFGYPKLDVYGELGTQGFIVSRVRRDNVHPMLQLSSKQIEGGFSGAPVWDTTNIKVVGMISETWTPKAGSHNRDTSFATPSEVLHAVYGEIPLAMAPTFAQLHNVPDLPQHYLAREELASVKDAVLKSNGKVGITSKGAEAGRHGKVGVQGMGGIGKSVLAAALAHDETVQQAYPDGVVWLAISQTPNLTARQEDLCFAVLGERENFKDEQQGKGFLRIKLAGKRCLVILDDVWELEHARALDVLGEGSCLLLTTRNLDVVRGLNAHEANLDLLEPDRALAFLGQWAGKEMADLPPEAREVVRECRRLPLALAMVGALVQRNPESWKSTLHRLKSADLNKLKVLFPDYPYPDLLRAIQVGVEALPEELRPRYLELAVFPEDTPIPQAALETLWALDGLNRYDVEDAITALVNRSLARRDEAGNLTLHDLQADYIRANEGTASVAPEVVECLCESGQYSVFSIP